MMTSTEARWKVAVTTTKKSLAMIAFSMVVHERHPALLWIGRTLGRFGHVAPNRAWRNADSDLQQQFVGNTLFTPSWIIEGHFLNEVSNGGGHRRTTARARFPFPKQTESVPMPSYQR